MTTLSIGNSVTTIGEGAFDYCSGLTEVISKIKKPFPISETVWNEVKTHKIPLYVPPFTKEKYENTAGWNVFAKIVERTITPVAKNDNVDYGSSSDIDDDTNLNGNIISNIYYNIDDGNGEYNSTEGCIVLYEATSDSEMDAVTRMDIFDDDMKEHFTGIILMMPIGSGTIKIDAESTGEMTLNVKVGSKVPATKKLDGKTKVSVPYSVIEPTYVYIYGGKMPQAGAKGMMKATTGGVLKIYGIEWSSDNTDSIEAIDNSIEAIDRASVYSLSGQEIKGTQLSKGIYIRSGKKILVK